MSNFFNGEHKVWINLLWSEKQRHANGTTWWECMRAHIGLSLGLWDEVYPEFDTNHIEVAGRAVGEYMTDYGMGTAIEILHLRGFRICVTEDGTM